MITSKNILNHELIGLTAKVTNTPIEGVIMDESKNTIIIRHEKKDKRVPKKGHEFVLKLTDGTFKVNGDVITQRPFERLKRQYKVNNRWEKTLVSKA
ncbi:Ribonuclease P protein component 1 [Candidatus Tiddalikarchaeum anstoanum]|nr:Ribonuclease P protein component 1 [Candidatus Tiddalikarchaeum anstoanum]